MTALNDFIGRLDEVDALLRHVAPEVDTHSPISHEKRRPFSNSTLARSCTVLIVSYFEGFIKDLSDESLDNLIENQLPCSRLESHFRGYVLADHLKNLREGRDPSRDWIAMQRVMETAAFMNSGRVIEERFLPRRQIKRAVTSIDPKKINELFKIFGDSDLNRGPLSRYGERLKSLKNIRDNAVHGNEGDFDPLSLGDALNYLELLKDCASAMSDRMDLLLSSLHGQAAVTKYIS
ncbi:MAE_28990/MAE_18760 family HEPN-like nuclease [Kocuria gwangalliensis]